MGVRLFRLECGLIALYSRHQSSITLLAMQIAWDHYFVLTLLLLLYFLRPASTALERLVAVAALLLIAQSPLNLIAPLETARQVAIGFAIATTALLVLTPRAALAPAPAQR